MLKERTSFTLDMRPYGAHILPQKNSLDSRLAFYIYNSFKFYVHIALRRVDKNFVYSINRETNLFSKVKNILFLEQTHCHLIPDSNL